MKKLTPKQAKIYDFLKSQEITEFTPKEAADLMQMNVENLQYPLLALSKKGYLNKVQINTHRAKYIIKKL